MIFSLSISDFGKRNRWRCRCSEIKTCINEMAKGLEGIGWNALFLETMTNRVRCRRGEMMSNILLKVQKR